MPQKAESQVKPIQITHGHTETHVALLINTVPQLNIYLTPEECRQVILHLQENLGRVEAIQAQKARH